MSKQIRSCNLKRSQLHNAYVLFPIVYIHTPIKRCSLLGDDASLKNVAMATSLGQPMGGWKKKGCGEVF